jgi:hypothetical protein
MEDYEVAKAVSANLDGHFSILFKELNRLQENESRGRGVGFIFRLDTVESCVVGRECDGFYFYEIYTSEGELLLIGKLNNLSELYYFMKVNFFKI